MKELLAVNGNLLFMENAKGEKEPVYEIIILTTESKYDLTNESGLVRKREVEEVRFFARERHLEKLSEQILGLPKELKELNKKANDSQSST